MGRNVGKYLLRLTWSARPSDHMRASEFVMQS